MPRAARTTRATKDFMVAEELGYGWSLIENGSWYSEGVELAAGLVVKVEGQS
jgi:hypothetical protein